MADRGTCYELRGGAGGPTLGFSNPGHSLIHHLRRLAIREIVKPVLRDSLQRRPRPFTSRYLSFSFFLRKPFVTEASSQLYDRTHRRGSTAPQGFVFQVNFKLNSVPENHSLTWKSLPPKDSPRVSSLLRKAATELLTQLDSYSMASRLKFQRVHLNERVTSHATWGAHGHTGSSGPRMQVKSHSDISSEGDWTLVG